MKLFAYAVREFDEKPLFDKWCAQLGVELRVLEASPLEDEQVRANGPLRCYYCKRMIFSALVSAAAADGFSEVWDGTNASDDASDRPGMRALAELSSEMQVLMFTCDAETAEICRSLEGVETVGMTVS